MRDRINQILNELNLSSSKLAVEINVQRSSISHILSGRNKPSFDFIQKLLKRYPEINAKWLLLGEGPVYVNETQSSLPFHETENQNKTETTSRESNINKQSRPSDQISSPGQEKSKLKAEKKIEKVILLYTDNSFEEYFPGNDK